jgi:hypothetical protein
MVYPFGMALAFYSMFSNATSYVFCMVRYFAT